MFKPPDWKDAANYPTPGKTSNAQFAWEFLRRNPAYGAAWGDYVEKLKEAAGADDELLRYVACIAAPEDSAKVLCEPFIDPAHASVVSSCLHDRPGLWIIEDMGDGTENHTPFTGQMGRVWGLVSMANPARADAWKGGRFLAAPRLVVPTSYSLAKLEEAEQDPVFGLSRSRWLVLQIDLELPSDVIEKGTMQYIKWARDFRAGQGWIKPIEHRAMQPALLVRYLQILDARRQGVAVARIGEFFMPLTPNDYPQNKRDAAIRAEMRTAERLRDGHYRNLPLLKDQKPPGRRLGRKR